MTDSHVASTLHIQKVSGPILGAVRPPGSKSITNRMYVLASLVRGDGVVRNPLRSEDTDGLLDALETLGSILRWEHDVVSIEGGDGRYPGGGAINLGAGGTPARFMLAAAALARMPVVVDGNARMRERPVAEGVELLREVGAVVDHVEQDGRLPVRVLPGETLAGGRIEVGRTASSQFISALMLVAPWTRDGIVVDFTEPPTSSTYLELTARCLEAAGGTSMIERNDGVIRRIQVPAGPLAGFDVDVEADASSAMYPAALAALVPGSKLEILGLPSASAQPDLAAIMAMREAGVDVVAHDDRLVVCAPDALKGFDLDCRDFPDAAVMLAVMAAAAQGVSRLSGLETLRVKECDRVDALARELARIGGRVDAGEGELVIDPSEAMSPAEVEVETYDDHRIAMAFGILGAARGGITIKDPDCAAKSHPGFFQDLAELTREARNGDTS
ncbi:MAG: 3-phosphoshikimate 1-carboxyvinyltransferase [Phycisphaerales bacterium]|nr:3-phosphoshikimate 1-carboxyvinyltransferase [Phycisphaerales bacterium]